MKSLRQTFLILTIILSLGVYAKVSSRDVAIARAKAVFIATANGDVAKLKQLMTPEFYRENYPYSDSQVREILLGVPAEKRKSLIHQIQNQCTPSTVKNRAGDVITVTLINKVTKKEITVQLIDEDETGNWKVFNYWY